MDNQPKQRATRVREVTLPDGRQGWEYSDGSVRNDHGHMIEPLPGNVRITSDNTRELLARRKMVGLRSQLEGLAAAQGVDPSEIDDELLLQAGSAVRALTQHMADTFKKSTSLRGMSEAYGALVTPLVGDRRQREADDAPSDQPTIFVLIAQYIQERARELPADVVDGEISD